MTPAVPVSQQEHAEHHRHADLEPDTSAVDDEQPAPQDASAYYDAGAMSALNPFSLVRDSVSSRACGFPRITISYPLPSPTLRGGL